MSKFTRSGHWRSSPTGGSHWVSAHTVDREVWDGTGALPSHLLQHIALQGRLTPVVPQLVAPKSLHECFMEPNATCPVCGAPVYYYQNAFGSKVYFDDVGPPWPKHPCMDMVMPVAGDGKQVKYDPTEPHRRGQGITRTMLDHFEKTRAASKGMAEGTGTSDPKWLIGRVTKIETLPSVSRFMLEIAYGKRQLVRRCASKRLPDWVQNGATVYVLGKSICIFDLNTVTPIYIDFDLVKH